MKKHKSTVVKEFKEFITKGNVVDLAVGVIIGGAFTKIVTSLTNDVLMPVIGAIMGNTDFKALRIPLGDRLTDSVTNADGTITQIDKLDDYGQVMYSSSIYYGRLIQNVIDFLLVALVLFLIVKIINNIRRKAEAAKKELLEKEKLEAEAKAEEKPVETK